MPDLRDADVVVVGAGAAGVSAALRLQQARLDVVVLEARGRIGGRAFTDTTSSPYPLDLGGEWLHSADRNPLVNVARRLGLTIDEAAPPWEKPTWPASMSPADEKDFEKAVGRYYDRLDQAAKGHADRKASELLQPGCRWNNLIDAASTYVNGVELDRVSVFDGENYDDSEIDWRLAEGYGALIARLGAGLPIRLNAPVERIDHTGHDIEVVTPQGAIRAGAVIVTAPTDLLAAGAIRFVPELPRKREAAAHLPLGLANKVFLSLDGAEEFERDTNVYGDARATATGNYYLRISGRPLVQGFFGGALARQLERDGPAAAADFAMTELANVMGGAFRARLRPLLATAWSADPFSRGSYAYALPGFAQERAVLAAPVDDRIFFAGEACSKHDFSTVHGAYKSGLEAAKALLKARRRATKAPLRPTAPDR